MFLLSSKDYFSIIDIIIKTYDVTSCHCVVFYIRLRSYSIYNCNFVIVNSYIITDIKIQFMQLSILVARSFVRYATLHSIDKKEALGFCSEKMRLIKTKMNPINVVGISWQQKSKITACPTFFSFVSQYRYCSTTFLISIFRILWFVFDLLRLTSYGFVTF